MDHLSFWKKKCKFSVVFPCSFFVFVSPWVIFRFSCNFHLWLLVIWGLICTLPIRKNKENLKLKKNHFRKSLTLWSSLSCENYQTDRRILFASCSIRSSQSSCSQNLLFPRNWQRLVLSLHQMCLEQRVVLVQLSSTEEWGVGAA